MKKYVIQQRIRSITDISIVDQSNPGTFSLEGIDFKQEFTFEHGPMGNYWFATFQIETNTWQEAQEIFFQRLQRIVSRISIIGQGYINFVTEPYLITSNQLPNSGIFRFVKDSGHVGLSLLDEGKVALEKLLSDIIVPDEFYLYWNDATNTTGYSAKLLLMLAAVESIVRVRDKNIFPRPEDISKKIFGDDLFKEIFNPQTGLRNRLSHGEYLIATDRTKDYVKEIHTKVIQFLNSEILKAVLLHEDVTGPQRSFFENKAGWFGFIKKVNPDDGNEMLLKDVLECFEKENDKSLYNTVTSAEFKILKELF